MKNIFLWLFFAFIPLLAVAQGSVYQINELSVINYGDGRLLFREVSENKTPLNGKYRLIDGYSSEYILAEFKDGMYNGDYKKFKNEVLVEEATYRAGKLNGSLKRFYNNGKVATEASFVDGKVNGVSKSFNQDGTVETEKEYNMGVEEGFDRRYCRDTHKLVLDTYYKNGKRDGKWTEYISSNIGDFTRISSYKDGLLEGKFTETWKDGKPKCTKSYKMGKKDGEWVNYRKTGVKEKSTMYKNDEKNGVEIIYFVDGSVEKTCEYVDDKLNGIVKEYYVEPHTIKDEYKYSNGVKEGAYKRYYDDDKIREEGVCEKDYEVYRKEYYKNGQIKSISERKRGGNWVYLERYDMDGNKECCH